MHISHLGKALLLATLVLTITGCARTVKYDTPRSAETKVEAPFYITFSPEGAPIVLASDGNPVKPQGSVVEIPTPSTIKRASQITALEIHGSHYYLLYIAGQYYKIPLPHY
jgi:hypothetical protein